MNKYQQEIINEYENYLTNTEEKYKKIDNIKTCEKRAQLELGKLKKLDEKHKLYDKNYENFRVAMSKLASAINKLEQGNNDKIKSKATLIKLNDEFEDLMQRNIIKDAYTWK